MTLGFVFTQTFAPGLLMSRDRFKIDIEGILNTVGRQMIANRCYDTSGRQDCGLLTRGVNPSVPGATYVLLAVNDTTTNLNTQDIAGYDLNLQYTREFGESSRAGAKLLVTHYDRADLYTGPTAPRVELLGFAGGSTSDQGFVETTANLDLDYRFRNFGVNWNIRYIGSGEMSPLFVGQGFPEVGSHACHNVRLSYESELFGAEQTQLYLGVSNAFDKEPPFFATSSSGTQALDTIPGYYDVFGRSYFAGIKVKR